MDYLSRFVDDPVHGAVLLLNSIARNAAAEAHFYGLLVAVLLLGLIAERRRGRAVLSIVRSNGFRVDAIYASLELLHVVQFLIIIPLGLAVSTFLKANLPWLKIESLAALPVWMQALLLFVFTDFWTYWYHRAQHASSILWQFHKTHHSQVNLTALTTFRKTIIDRVVEIFILALPPVLMDVSFAMPLAIIFILQFHQLIIHSNAGWSFGRLGRVIVSPEFHELHHSRAAAHRDRNFGAVLSFWDALFGSRIDGRPEHLEFGVSDERIPETYFGQMVVPLTGLWALAFGKKVAA